MKIMRTQIMELRKKNLFVFVILMLFWNCSNKFDITGDWEVLDTQGEYAELFFTKDIIRIHTETAGAINPQTYRIINDSIFTPVLNYQIRWVNPDSLILEAGAIKLYLRRIFDGFRLSQFSEESIEEAYQNDFYNRLLKRKGIRTPLP